jgi:hypothetical protein
MRYIGNTLKWAKLDTNEKMMIIKFLIAGDDELWNHHFQVQINPHKSQHTKK